MLCVGKAGSFSLCVTSGCSRLGSWMVCGRYPCVCVARQILLCLDTWQQAGGSSGVPHLLTGVSRVLSCLQVTSHIRKARVQFAAVGRCKGLQGGGNWLGVTCCADVLATPLVMWWGCVCCSQHERCSPPYSVHSVVCVGDLVDVRRIHSAVGPQQGGCAPPSGAVWLSRPCRLAPVSPDLGRRGTPALM